MKHQPLLSRRKTALLSTSITVAVVVCLILVNLVAAVVTKTYPVKIDLTTDKVFQLSQESIDYITELDRPVQLTVLNTRDGFTRGGAYFEQAMAVLEQYAQYNNDITLSFVDLLANPAYASQYPDYELSVNDILVVCDNQLEQLTAYDIFQVEQSWYGGSITSSNAEQAMTGAIMNVASGDKVGVAFVGGHEEADSTALEQLLSKNGFQPATVSTIMEDIPADTELLVLAAPRRDFTADEIAKLDAFLENGGLYGRHLLYFAAAEQPALPLLDAFLEKWGLAVASGVIAETNPNRVMSNNAYFGVVDLDDQTLAGMMRSPNVPLAVPFARPVERLFESKLGYTTQSLLSYSETAGVAAPEIQDISDIVPSGPISIGARTVYAKGDQSSSVNVFGSDWLFNARMLESSSLANADYLLSAFNTISARENALFIAPKTLGGGLLAINQAQVLIYTILLLVVLPLVTLAVGITIWIKRKRA